MVKSKTLDNPLVFALVNPLFWLTLVILSYLFEGLFQSSLDCTYVFFIVACVMSLLRYRRDGCAYRQLQFFDYVLIIYFICYFLISLFTSAHVITVLKVIASLSIPYFLVRFLRITYRDILCFVWTYLLIMGAFYLCITICFLLDYFEVHDMSFILMHNKRLFISKINPNALSKYACISYFLAFMLLHHGVFKKSLGKLNTFVGFCIAELSVLAIQVSGTMGGVLSIVLGSAVFLFFAFVYWRKRFWKILLMLLFICVSTYGVIVQGDFIIEDKINTLFNQQRLNHYLFNVEPSSYEYSVFSIAQRSYNYQKTFEESFKKPLLGHGENSIVLNKGDRDKEITIDYPHNFFLEVFYKTGIVGLIICSMYLISSIMCVVRRILQERLCSAQFSVLFSLIPIALFIAAQFSFSLYMHKDLFIVYATLLSFVYCKNEDRLCMP